MKWHDQILTYNCICLSEWKRAPKKAMKLKRPLWGKMNMFVATLYLSRVQELHEIAIKLRSETKQFGFNVSMRSDDRAITQKYFWSGEPFYLDNLFVKRSIPTVCFHMRSFTHSGNPIWENNYKLTINVSVTYQEYIQYPSDYTYNFIPLRVKP